MLPDKHDAMNSGNVKPATHMFVSKRSGSCSPYRASAQPSKKAEVWQIDVHKRWLTAAKAVNPEEASHRASMKSRVAPKVLCLRRGEEGGEHTSGSGDT